MPPDIFICHTCIMLYHPHLHTSYLYDTHCLQVHACIVLSHPHIHTPSLHHFMPPGIFICHTCIILYYPHLHTSYLHHNKLPHSLQVHACIILSHPYLHTPSLHHFMPPGIFICHTCIMLYHPHLHTSYLHDTHGLQVHACIHLLIAQYTLRITDRHVFYERLASHACVPDELVLAIISQCLELWLSLKYSTHSI